MAVSRCQGVKEAFRSVNRMVVFETEIAEGQLYGASKLVVFFIIR